MAYFTIMNGKKGEWLRLFVEAGFEVIAVRNENFQPALYWAWRNVFPVEYNPSSGEILANRLSDKIFWFILRQAARITFGGSDFLGCKLFPKSWYFYLMKNG